MRNVTYFSFIGSNTMDCETSLNIIDQTEEFTSLFDGDNVYKYKFNVSKMIWTMEMSLANIGSWLNHDFRSRQGKWETFDLRRLFKNASKE